LVFWGLTKLLPDGEAPKARVKQMTDGELTEAGPEVCLPRPIVNVSLVVIIAYLVDDPQEVERLARQAVELQACEVRQRPILGLPLRCALSRDRSIESICCQQPHTCMVSKASLTDERSGIKFRTLLGVGSGESSADVPSRCRERMGSRGVLLLSRLTLPPSAGTTVGASEIKE